HHADDADDELHPRGCKNRSWLGSLLGFSFHGFLLRYLSRAWPAPIAQLILSSTALWALGLLVFCITYLVYQIKSTTITPKTRNIWSLRFPAAASTCEEAHEGLRLRRRRDRWLPRGPTGPCRGRREPGGAWHAPCRNAGRR